MSTLTQSDLQSIIDTITDPSSGQSLSRVCKITSVTENANSAVIGLDFSYPMRGIESKLMRLIEQALASSDLCAKTIKCSIDSTINIPVQSVQKSLRPFKGIKNIIAIASGKGGVGKSTTTVNLALAMVAEGAKVGILDADIYGPSIPRMLNISGRPETRDGKTVIPKDNYGLQAMSIGFLVDEDAPMIWRGPMVTQALHQLLTDTQWDDLDYLFIDLPPGTGDIQLTLAQKIPVSGAIIVTTPQDIALLDARKALNMFNKVEVPVLGIVENMSIHICSKCGHQEHIFGAGGGERMSSDYGVDFLGSLPLNIRIREEADTGQPSVVNDPDGDIATMYRKIARRAGAYLAMQAKDFSHKFPEIVIEKNS